MAQHYDGTCKALCKPGQGSFLYGWQWDFEFDRDHPTGFNNPNEVIEVTASTHELDLLCKITEAAEADPTLAMMLRRTMREASEEWRRLNCCKKTGRRFDGSECFGCLDCQK